MSRLSTPLALVFAVATVACASSGTSSSTATTSSAGAPSRPRVPATVNNVDMSIETVALSAASSSSEGTASALRALPEAVIVTNHSTEDIRVTGVTLHNCYNVQGGCGVHRARVVVKAGDRRQVLRINPVSRGTEMRYDADYSFEVVGAQAAAAAPVAPAGPATNESVLLSYQPAETGYGQMAWVQNRSAETIVVTRFELLDCENVDGPCGPREVHVVVEPGQRRSISLIRPRERSAPVTWHATWHWERMP